MSWIVLQGLMGEGVGGLVMGVLGKATVSPCELVLFALHICVLIKQFCSFVIYYLVTA